MQFLLDLSVGSTYIVKSGLTTLAKIGRLEDTLREHEGEVKAWQTSKSYRETCYNKNVLRFFASFFFLNVCILNVTLLLHLVNVFLFNFHFMLCITIIELIFVDIRVYLFHLLKSKRYTENVISTLKMCFLPLFLSKSLPYLFKACQVDCWAMEKLQILKLEENN